MEVGGKDGEERREAGKGEEGEDRDAGDEEVRGRDVGEEERCWGGGRVREMGRRRMLGRKSRGDGEEDKDAG